MATRWQSVECETQDAAMVVAAYMPAIQSVSASQSGAGAVQPATKMLTSARCSRTMLWQEKSTSEVSLVVVAKVIS